MNIGRKGDISLKYKKKSFPTSVYKHTTIKCVKSHSKPKEIIPQSAQQQTQWPLKIKTTVNKL